MSAPNNTKAIVWKEPVTMWFALLLVGLLALFLFYDSLEWMVTRWIESEEYGYGFLIPVISIFLIWQKKDRLEYIQFQGNWFGPFVVVVGLFLYLLGELSTLYIIIQYSFLVVITGLFLSLMGWKGIKEVWVPLFFLVFMIPLPVFLYQGLSAQLQLISSELGVAVIRLFGISVYLEGNVIDLGVYKLQVVEACSGLRYLFPLASLAFISAYLFKAALWKRVVVFLSSIPVTIAMNSFRIGVIGILVEYYGQGMAEGFLHYFEGWIIFMACMSVLLLEMWVLTKIGNDKRPLREAFAVEFPTPTQNDAEVRYRTVPKSYWIAGALVLATSLFSLTLEERVELAQQRKQFSEFPMQVGEWRGRSQRMEKIYIDELDFSDYVLANYVNSENRTISFYVAYYASQRKGESAHSPRSCLPGGGWRIVSLKDKSLDDVKFGNTPLRVNRTVIQKGEYKQLVYYWFQERDRNITNEYMVKWYLFWDSLTRNRTDGALIRLMAFVKPGEDIVDAETQLTNFLREVNLSLKDYVPG